MKYLHRDLLLVVLLMLIITPVLGGNSSVERNQDQAAGAKTRAGTGSKFAWRPPIAATAPVTVKLHVEVPGADSDSHSPNAGQAVAGNGKAQDCTKSKSKFCGGPPKAAPVPVVVKMQVEVPGGGKPNTTTHGQPGARTGKPGNNDIRKRCDEGILKGKVCDCLEGTLEGKACDSYRKLLLKKMEKAMTPVDAGKTAKDELEFVQDTTQAGLKNVVDNLKAIEGVLDAGMPKPLEERNLTAPDLGDSDSLGSLD